MLDILISSSMTSQNDTAANFAAASKSLLDNGKQSVSEGATHAVDAIDAKEHFNEFELHFNQVIARNSTMGNDKVSAKVLDNSKEATPLSDEEVELLVEQVIAYLADESNTTTTVNGKGESSDIPLDKATIKQIIEALPTELQRGPLGEQPIESMAQAKVIAQAFALFKSQAPSEPEQQTSVPIDESAKQIVAPLIEEGRKASTDDTTLANNATEQSREHAKSVANVEPKNVEQQASGENKVADGSSIVTDKAAATSTDSTDAKKTPDSALSGSSQVQVTQAPAMTKVEQSQPSVTAEENNKVSQVQAQEKQVQQKAAPATEKVSHQQVKDLQAKVQRVEQASQAQAKQPIEAELAATLDELKVELKATIMALPLKEQQQLKQQLTPNSKSDAKPDAKALTPEQLLEQISVSQQKVVSKVAVDNVESQVQGGVQNLINIRQQGEQAGVDARANISKASEVNVSNTMLSSDNAESTDEVKVKQTEVNPSAKLAPATFESMIKQLEGHGKATVEPSSPATIVNSRLDQQELQAGHTNASSSATKTFNEQLMQKTPLHEQFAASNLKQKLGMMVNGGISKAVISLDPEELGAMSIRIVMQQDQMNVQFQVQNPAAKEMLEQAMGKLKDMLEEQGIALNHGDVEQQSQGQQTSHETSGSNGEASEEFDSEEAPTTLVLHKQSANGIDYYA